MRINTTIVDAYLNSEDVGKYSSEWFYTDRTEGGMEFWNAQLFMKVTFDETIV